MNILVFLRRLRHGPLRSLGPIWISLGRLYRGLLPFLPFKLTTTTRIGAYGPFILDGRFTFSRFDDWGTGKNACFQATVEACSGAMCVLDVGAHIGLITLPVSEKIAPQGRIFAFEPGDFNRALLVSHVEMNNIENVEVIPGLIGETDEEGVAFYQFKGDNPMNSVSIDPNSPGVVRTTKTQISLDSFCQGRQISPDVIKVDVEGSEIGLLRGARKIIAQAQPVIFLSVHPRQIRDSGQEIEELSNLIEECGYICSTFDGLPSKPDKALEYILTPKDTPTQ